MKSIDQEELIQHLGTLNYPELKAVVSCGIPGHAQSHALLMLKAKHDALDAFIKSDGVEAVMETEVEDIEEENNGSVEGIQPSESGREGDSKKMGESSTDPGT